MSDESTRNEVDRLMRLSREHEARPEESEQDARIMVQISAPDRPATVAVDLDDFRWSYDWVMVPGPDTIQ